MTLWVSMQKHRNLNHFFDMEMRADIATRAMVALIGRYSNTWSKKQIVDNAIAYADMMLRRLQEIPVDAQQRSEAGQRPRPRVNWDEITSISEAK